MSLGEDDRQDEGGVSDDDAAAQRTLLYQLGLFPACGHHRVVASLELAAEKEELKYLEKWSGVRVIAPPEGEYWVNAVRILGFYDNLPVATEMSFADKMIYLRRDYVDNFADSSGEGYRPPIADMKKGFRQAVSKILRTNTPSVLTPTVAFLTRPPAVWDLIKMVLTGDVKKKKTLPFNNPTSCNTIHALSPLPNDLVTELLKQIVSREVTCSQANNKAKELRATALAREYILDTAKKHHPKATKDFKNWGHLIKQWPQLDHVADTAVGYFKKKNRQQRQHIPALERDVLATIKLQEDIRTKRIDPSKVDRGSTLGSLRRWMSQGSSLPPLAPCTSSCSTARLRVPAHGYNQGSTGPPLSLLFG